MNKENKIKNQLYIIKQFFRHPCIMFNVIFPISAFKKILHATHTFKLDMRWKGKMRSYTFFGQSYYDFLNDKKSQDFLVNFREIPSYTKSCCLSYTDLYNLDNLKKFNNLYPKKLTYTKWIYKEHYKKWSDNVDELMKQYKYYAYIDIESYYDEIYTHFLFGIEVKDIKTFNDYEENYRNKEWLKDHITTSVFDFFKSFEKHMNHNNQTKGIAIGNGISDFVAELYNKMIDFFVTSNSNLKEIKILRYRDDIYIFLEIIKIMLINYMIVMIRY